jgi:ketosteroid isomerase-like protein
MKKMMCALYLALIAFGCAGPDQKTMETAAPAPTIDLPYKAIFSSNVNADISDEELLVVLKSYKDWETGDMKSLRTAFGDSLHFNRWDGTYSTGLVDDVFSNWVASRDSLTSVKIDMAVWTKNNFPDKGHKNITVWYTETSTYKDGRVTKADWHDINEVKDGKIVWYAQYRRPYKE